MMRKSNYVQKKLIPEILGLLSTQHGPLESDVCIWNAVDCFVTGFPMTTRYAIEQGQGILFGKLIRETGSDGGF